MKKKPSKEPSAIKAMAELMRKSPLAEKMIREAAQKAMQPEPKEKEPRSTPAP